MFLTKKTANLSNKNKDKNKTKKALGGWGDEDQQSNPPINTNSSINNAKQTTDYLNMDKYQTAPCTVPNYSSNKFEHGPKNDFFQPPQINIPTKETQRPNKNENMFYTSQELLNLSKIQCQRKLVSEITEPGGIRIKPNQKMLIEFLQECKSLDIGIIGSLLIEVLYHEDNNFQMKAKSLYVIQYLCKKKQHYLFYFKLHHEKLKETPEPDQNVDNFRKIKKNVMTIIGDVFRDENRNDDILEFSDPGYGKQKGVISDLLQIKNPDKNKHFETQHSYSKKAQISLLDNQQQIARPQNVKKQKNKKLISPNQMKKKLTGPNTTHKMEQKPPLRKQSNNNNDNLLDFQEATKKSKTHTNFTQNNNIDLLGQQNPPKKVSDDITFDDLISKNKPDDSLNDLKL